MSEALLIYDSPEKNPDLYYATRFLAPDPVLFLVVRGRSCLVLGDLEVDRARREARVQEVVSINPYVERARKRHASFTQADVLCEVLRHKRIRRIVVPADSPFALMEALKNRGFGVRPRPNPFFPERLVKGAEERRLIVKSQHAIFASMRMAREVLALSRAAGGRLRYRGLALTSERLRSMINVFLCERGYEASGTIVACGRHAVDPHDVGSGPLRAHSAIIIDVFPRSTVERYYGDATRTFCKGRAPDALLRMYATVKAAQAAAIRMVRAGANGRKIHEAVHSFFRAEGFATGVRNGRNEGFFHGTGHSIGLEVHEEPARITARDYLLKAGNVMSVEPGLYYPGVGGVRIEDLVYVQKSGCEVLGSFPKRLEIL